MSGTQPTNRGQREDGHRRVKVAHLTSAHTSCDTRIHNKMCRSLAQAEYDVHLVAPRSDEPEPDADSGVHIHYVPRPRNRFARMTSTTCQVLATARQLDPDVCHLHDPELIPVGLVLKLAGRKVIFDAHEDLPRQVLTKPWIPAWLRRPVSAATTVLEAAATRFFDAIVAATPAIARKLPTSKTTTIQNFPILGELLSPLRRPFAERGNVAVFVGVMLAERGICEMVRAMRLLPDRLDAKLVLAGRFLMPDLEGTVMRLPGADRVEYAGWLDRPAAAELLGRARVGLVLFHPLPNHTSAQPNKLFEYMSAGIPVVASHFPLWRQIVEDADCGLLVDPQNPSAIAEAMTWLFEHPAEAEAMGERGRGAVKTHYNWDVEAQKLLTLYRTLAR